MEESRLGVPAERRVSVANLAHPLPATWALVAVFGVLTFVTYTRVPPEQLYNVSREGIAGGASRTLVYLNFPVAFVAIGVLLVCLERLRERRLRVLGLVGIALCAVAAWPGVLDQDDLDARPINALPAAGVAVAAALTVLYMRDPSWTWARPAGRLRVVVAVAAGLMSVPWLFAEAGFYAPDPILSDEVPAGEHEVAVHLGGHHGTYGVIMVLSALALSRLARRSITSIVLALLFAYGGTIAAEDFWHEQIQKRGTSDWTFPSALSPGLDWVWLGIVLAAAAIELLWFRRERRATPRAPAPR
ncbi:MAG TPA: hypothetical protein VGJ58_09780 [Gaiellaceae bacterium]|jgi:hypothetical protein